MSSKFIANVVFKPGSKRPDFSSPDSDYSGLVVQQQEGQGHGVGVGGGALQSGQSRRLSFSSNLLPTGAVPKDPNI